MIDYLTDPVLRGPTIGSALMCLGAAWIGVIVLLRKESLLGEALSHAAYPGVFLGVAAFAALELDSDLSFSLIVLLGAFLTAFFGLWAIQFLEVKGGVKSDAALCFVLSSFFGVALTLSSRMQFTHTGLYRQGLSYLFGQAATMTDLHIAVYGGLAFAVIASISLFFKELQAITLDRNYAKTLGIPVRAVDFCLFFLIVLSLVIGIRSVGVVLMSAMLVAPAAAARQLTSRLSRMLLLAGLFGLLSGWLGNVLSVEASSYLLRRFPEERLILPTGPMIVLTASSFCLLALFLAPERGLFIRWLRRVRFQRGCLSENLLKELWRAAPGEPKSFAEIQSKHHVSGRLLRALLGRLIRNGWVEEKGRGFYRLTQDGFFRASRIVRLHRLWEVYLSDYLGIGVEKVHRSAEEMEHILTPELEERLTLLLSDPKKDPHQQPIPPKERPLR